MWNNFRDSLVDLLLKRSGKHCKWLLGLLLGMLPLVYLFVYYTGGIKYVYSHTMYIPISLAAIVFGMKGGLVFGLLGGILLGPVMPLTIEPLEWQSIWNWGYRLIIFISVGGFVGFVCDRLRKQFSMINFMYAHDTNTGLPNFQHYKSGVDPTQYDEQRIAMTVIIDNYEDIVALIGREAYHAMINEVYKELVNIFETAYIIQVDERKLWIDLDANRIDEQLPLVVDYFEDRVFLTSDVPMFVDVFLGISSKTKTKSTRLDKFLKSEIAAIYARKNQLRFAFYEEKFTRASNNLERLGALPSAIKNNDLFIEYQPIIDFRNNEVVALEALVRWRYKGQVVEPLDFIPVAEETKLIDTVTEWIVQQVLKDYPMLTEEKPYIIGINLSQRNLYNPGLIDRIIDMIKAQSFKNRAIAIEMTESTLMLNRELTKTLIDRLREHNITTAIDDFGTGYSTLTALTNLTIDKIKIARELIMELLTKKSSESLVKMIIDYAHSIDKEVIAEGIENADVEAKLIEFGCDYGQGFYYTRPKPLNDIRLWLSDRIQHK